jgi:hypothetical protein
MNYTYADIEKLVSDRGLDTKIKSVFGEDTTILYRDIETNRTRDYFLNKYFTADSLYYIEKIKDTNPSRIIHIGCGSNVFKKIYGDLIYGVDIQNPEADELNIWDSQFLLDNYEKFDAAISICSLQPSLTMLESTISDFISLLSPKGIGYLSFSSPILINFTPYSELENIQSDEEELLSLSSVYESTLPGDTNKVPLKSFIDNIVYKFKDNIIEYSNLMDDPTLVSTAMDGDIRILLKKI